MRHTHNRLDCYFNRRLSCPPWLGDTNRGRFVVRCRRVFYFDCFGRVGCGKIVDFLLLSYSIWVGRSLDRLSCRKCNENYR